MKMQCLFSLSGFSDCIYVIFILTHFAVFLADRTCPLCFTADLWLRGPPYAPVQTANGEPHHHALGTALQFFLFLAQVF